MSDIFFLIICIIRLALNIEVFF